MSPQRTRLLARRPLDHVRSSKRFTKTPRQPSGGADSRVPLLSPFGSSATTVATAPLVTHDGRRRLVAADNVPARDRPDQARAGRDRERTHSDGRPDKSGSHQGDRRHGRRGDSGRRGGRPRLSKSILMACWWGSRVHTAAACLLNSSREAEMFMRLLRILRIKRYFRKRR
jgi:hypothetical protein